MTTRKSLLFFRYFPQNSKFFKSDFFPEKLIVTTFLMLFCFLSPAQILTTLPSQLNENVFSDNVFFNEKFLRQNNVKSINCEISFKRDFQPIVKEGTYKTFEFNRDGRLIKQTETKTIAGNIKDTAATFYFYNEKNQLFMKRSTDGYGFYAYSFEFDSLGNISKQIYSRDENTGSKMEFQLGKRFIIHSESYQYEQVSDNHKKQRIFNDNGMEYRVKSTFFNEYGNMSEEESKFIVGGRKTTVTYLYDEYFRLAQKVDFSSVSGDNKIVSTFSYDDFGNIMQEKISRNGTLKTTREFLYDKKNFLLDAQLIKDEATQTIHIYKYSYEFF